MPWLLLTLPAGCSNLMLKRPGVPVSLEPPPAVAAPAASLPPLGSAAATPLPSYADVDARQLQTTLARNQDENQLLKDEITALREQLASTSSQLALSRSTGGTTTPWNTPGAQGAPGASPAQAMMQPDRAPVPSPTTGRRRRPSGTASGVGDGWNWRRWRRRSGSGGGR
ncbi:MAG: hypothetical protein ACKOK8_03615, partial [Planctomycetia bacterium]